MIFYLWYYSCDQHTYHKTTYMSSRIETPNETGPSAPKLGQPKSK